LLLWCLSLGACASLPVAQAVGIAGKATLSIKIVIPPRSQGAGAARRPGYVSASTVSVAVTLTPAGAAPGPPAILPCSVAACSGQVGASLGSNTLTVTAYDGAGGTGNKLSTSTTTITVGANTANTVNLTLNGIVSKVAATLPGANFNPGTASNATATVQFQDADGNTIIGSGAPVDVNGNPVTVTLASSEVGGNATTSVLPATITSISSNTATVSYTGRGIYSGQLSVSASPLAITTPAPLPYTVGPANIQTFGAANGMLAGAKPDGLVYGPDGNVWFTDQSGNNAVGKITFNGAITEYAAGITGTLLNDVTVGSDGKLWFTESGSGKIGRITTGGAVTEFASSCAGPNDITTGPDGNVWYSGNGCGGIGKMTTTGVESGYGITGNGDGIGVGPDGNIWSAENGAGRIARVTTAGVVTEFLTPNEIAIRSGPDGALWFTTGAAGKIGRITTAGAVTLLNTTAVNTVQIVSGNDGNLWIADLGNNQVVRFTTAGVETDYALGAGLGPTGIISASDGTLWVTDYSGGKITRLIY
jgi:virginiamycin B lyase